MRMHLSRAPSAFRGITATRSATVPGVLSIAFPWSRLAAQRATRTAKSRRMNEPKSARGAAQGWMTLATVGIGVSVGPLDTSVNIAFPSITEAFEIPVELIQWVVICYVLTYASLLLGFGRLADAVGHRRVFIIGLLASVVGLLACALAESFSGFLAARSIQGIGAAFVLGAGPALATLSFPESQRGRVVGVYTMLFAVGSASGPLIGGLLVDRWGWSSVFWYRIPIAVVALGLVLVCIKPIPIKRDAMRFDLSGAIAVSVAAASTLFFMNRLQHLGIASVQTVLVLVLAILSCTFLFFQQRAAAQPLIPLSVLRRGRFLLANTAHALIQLACFTVMLVGPFYLVGYLENNAVKGGLLLAVSPLGVVLAAPIAGRLVDSVSPERLGLAGLALATCGLGGIAWFAAQAAPTAVALCLLAQGLGLGLFQVANMDFVMGAIPRDSQGVAGSLTMMMRTVGVVTGASAGALLFAHLREGEGGSFISAFQGTFAAAAVVAGVAFAMMLLALRCRPQGTEDA